MNGLESSGRCINRFRAFALLSARSTRTREGSPDGMRGDGSGSRWDDLVEVTVDRPGLREATARVATTVVHTWLGRGGTAGPRPPTGAAHPSGIRGCSSWSSHHCSALRGVMRPSEWWETRFSRRRERADTAVGWPRYSSAPTCSASVAFSGVGVCNSARTTDLTQSCGLIGTMMTCGLVHGRGGARWPATAVLRCWFHVEHGL